MPLELITNPGVPNANAYATLNEAAAVAQYRTGPARTAWDELDADARVRAIATAARQIDTLPYLGRRASKDQALEFPRQQLTDRQGRRYPSTEIPAAVVSANIERAFEIALEGDAANPVEVAANELKRVKADDVEVEYFSPPDVSDPTGLSRFSAFVQSLLERFVVPERVAVGEWGQSTAARAS